MHGGINGEMVADHKLRIHAWRALDCGLLKIRILEVARVEGAETTHQSVRNQLDVAARGNSFQTVHCGGLPESAFDFEGDVRPERVLTLAVDAPIENDAPLLHLRGGKAQALEGNLHPYNESVACDFPARVPHRVKRSVEVALRFFLARGLGPDRVPLHAERRGLEGIGATAVVKCVEDDLDLVVIVNVFAARQPGAHLLRIVEADENRVKIFLVITEIGVGWLRYAFAVVRIALREAGDFGHFQGRIALRLHRQEIVKRWRTRQPGNRDGGRRNLRLGRRFHLWIAYCRLGQLRRRRWNLLRWRSRLSSRLQARPPDRDRPDRRGRQQKYE